MCAALSLVPPTESIYNGTNSLHQHARPLSCIPSDFAKLRYELHLQTARGRLYLPNVYAIQLDNAVAVFLKVHADRRHRWCKASSIPSPFILSSIHPVVPVVLSGSEPQIAP
jgi:hypothetical protein